MRQRPFLRGPLDMAWLRAAMQLRGSALAVAIQILFIAGLKRTSTVRVRLASIPISRSAAARGLTRLERADLVRVQRTTGHWPTVTILEVRDE